MLLKYFEYIFITLGSFLCLGLIVHKVYFCKIKDNIKKSNFVVIIAGLLTFYIISAMVLALYIPNYYNKIIMFLFAIAPFIIGKYATFEKEPFYTFLQLICVLSSVIFVCYNSIISNTIC